MYALLSQNRRGFLYFKMIKELCPIFFINQMRLWWQLFKSLVRVWWGCGEGDEHPQQPQALCISIFQMVYGEDDRKKLLRLILNLPYIQFIWSHFVFCIHMLKILAENFGLVNNLLYFCHWNDCMEMQLIYK